MPKRIHFSYKGIVLSSMIAALDHNAIVDRLKVQECVQWSKAQKTNEQ